MTRFFATGWFTGPALLLVAVLGLVVWRQRPVNLAVERRVNNLQHEITETEQKNSALASMSDYFKSDAYLEKEAKLKLNVKRPDEQAVFIKEGAGDSSPAPSPSALPFWKKWLEYLFK